MGKKTSEFVRVLLYFCHSERREESLKTPAPSVIPSAARNPFNSDLERSSSGFHGVKDQNRSLTASANPVHGDADLARPVPRSPA